MTCEGRGCVIECLSIRSRHEDIQNPTSLDRKWGFYLGVGSVTPSDPLQGVTKCQIQISGSKSHGLITGKQNGSKRLLDMPDPCISYFYGHWGSAGVTSEQF